MEVMKWILNVKVRSFVIIKDTAAAEMIARESHIYHRDRFGIIIFIYPAGLCLFI